MMKYERLTMEGSVFDNIINCVVCPNKNEKYTCRKDKTNCLKAVINRLAELEDKIERGELVENNVVTYVNMARSNGKTLVDKALKYDELKAKIEQGTLKEEKTCKNIAEMHPSDGFTCSECGITIIDFREERVDEDCTASWYEYEMKYCPNCGAKIKY